MMNKVTDFHLELSLELIALVAAVGLLYWLKSVNVGKATFAKVVGYVAVALSILMLLCTGYRGVTACYKSNMGKRACHDMPMMGKPGMNMEMMRNRPKLPAGHPPIPTTNEAPETDSGH